MRRLCSLRAGIKELVRRTSDRQRGIFIMYTIKKKGISLAFNRIFFVCFFFSFLAEILQIFLVPKVYKKKDRTKFAVFVFLISLDNLSFQIPNMCR